MKTIRCGFVVYAPSKTREPAKKWGQPSLSQGAPFATRGQSGLSPFFRPVRSSRRFHPHRCPIAGQRNTHACRVATRGAARPFPTRPSRDRRKRCSSADVFESVDDRTHRDPRTCQNSSDDPRNPRRHPRPTPAPLRISPRRPQRSRPRSRALEMDPLASPRPRSNAALHPHPACRPGERHCPPLRDDRPRLRQDRRQYQVHEHRHGQQATWKSEAPGSRNPGSAPPSTPRQNS